MTKDLGFGKGKLDLSGFEPRKGDDIDARDANEVADRAAERAGFNTREAVERVERVRKSKEPIDQAFVRAPISVINRFKLYCNDTGMSYGEALESLMKKAGI